MFRFWIFRLLSIAHSSVKPIQMKPSMTFMQSNGCAEIDSILKVWPPFIWRQVSFKKDHSWLLVLGLYKEDYLQFFYCLSFWVRSFCAWDPVNHFHHTSVVAFVTLTDRPKSVCNRCVIGVLVAFCVVTLRWYFVQAFSIIMSNKFWFSKTL